MSGRSRFSRSSSGSASSVLCACSSASASARSMAGFPGDSFRAARTSATASVLRPLDCASSARIRWSSTDGGNVSSRATASVASRFAARIVQ